MHVIRWWVRKLRESIWGYAVIVLGIVAIGVIWFFANTTKTDQHNYYLLKETTEAAMLDSVDLAAYRANGQVKIETDVFVENFIRRFSENADLSDTYVIEIYDVNEMPPKVSLKVSSTKTSEFNSQTVEFDMVNHIDAILELKNKIVAPQEENVTGSSDFEEGQGTNEDLEICTTHKLFQGEGINVGGRYICKLPNGIDTTYFSLIDDYGDGTVRLLMDYNYPGDDRSYSYGYSQYRDVIAGIVMNYASDLGSKGIRYELPIVKGSTDSKYINKVTVDGYSTSGYWTDSGCLYYRRGRYGYDPVLEKDVESCGIRLQLTLDVKYIATTDEEEE